MKARLFAMVTAATVIGLGIGQAIAAPAHTGSSSISKITGPAVAGPRGVSGDNDVIRPDCLQPNVLVQTPRGLVWERKAECSA